MTAAAISKQKKHKVMHLTKKDKGIYLDVADIFMNELSEYRGLHTLYQFPQDHIEKTIACVVDGEVVGGLKRGFCPNTNSVLIDCLAINSKYQRRGLGKRLINSLEAFTEQRGITTIKVEADSNSLGFYKKLGYKPITEYDGQAIWMQKRLMKN